MMKPTSQSRRRERLLRLTLTALFSAIAYVVTLVVRLPVSFLTMDVKDAVIAVCGLCFGPLYALAVAILVPLLEMITVSSTGWYGFLMNALSSTAFAVTASAIYRRRKTLGGAILGLLSACVVTVAVMMEFNLIITPLYMHAPIEAVRDLILPLLLPFNAVKVALNAGLVLLIYKPIARALRVIEDHPTPNAAPRRTNTAVALSLAALLIVGSLLVLFLVLEGKIEWFRV